MHLNASLDKDYRDGEMRLHLVLDSGPEPGGRASSRAQTSPEIRAREDARPPGQAVLPCLTTDKLLADARWARQGRDLMLEVIAAARALGFDIPDVYADQQIERTRTMGAYRASTLIDFERGHPLELQSLFLEPLRQATQAGVPMPRLSALCVVLKDLDRSAQPTR